VKKAMPLPTDVRLMNMATALLVLVFVLLALGSGAWWLIRHPSFALQTITVQGEVHRNNAFAFRTHVLPKLEGNFFTLDLAQARQTFESVPWVRVAVVHRDFPNRLRAVLLEHKPIALWGAEDAGTLINEQGQVFEAVLDDADAERLPRMKGPVADSQNVAAMYRALSPRLAALDMEIEQLELTPRGSWRVQTHQGAQLELGRGSHAEVLQRLDMFLKTLKQVTNRYGRGVSALAGADLRHKDAYALRLHGVSTVEADIKKKP
jgi:cell division protein FtsQ